MRFAFVVFALMPFGWPTAAIGQLDPSLPQPRWFEPAEREVISDPAVVAGSDLLLDTTLASTSAEALIRHFQRVRSDTSRSAALRDAILFDYVHRLRSQPPDSAPQAALQWLASIEPLAVTGHEEGPHHPVALFNVAAAATGLANQWQWQRGHEDVTGPAALPPDDLARLLSKLQSNEPRAQGMRHAIDRLTPVRLDQLSMACASAAAGCGALRADIELARGNLRWLNDWLDTAPAQAVLPRLQRARTLMTKATATQLMEHALNHPDSGIAAWAMGNITSHLPKDHAERRAWGQRLVDLLSEPKLGSAAALQLVRMDSGDWLEAAATGSLDERARRRLQLMAEMEDALQAARPDGEARR